MPLTKLEELHAQGMVCQSPDHNPPTYVDEKAQPGTYYWKCPACGYVVQFSVVTADAGIAGGPRLGRVIVGNNR